jgi:iron complex transport system permease protein
VSGPAVRTRTLLVLAVGLVAALAAGAVIGPAGFGFPGASILLGVRAPRVALAAIVGGGLAMAGALLQPLLRNPLADPFLLGISGGAALGGIVALIAGEVWGLTGWLGDVTLPVTAFVGALGATGILYLLTTVPGRRPPGHSVLLCGVVLNALASALILLLITAASLDEMAGAFLWLIGEIRPRPPWIIAALGVLLVVALARGTLDAHALNLLSQGDEVAAQLGVDATAVRRRILIVTSLVIGGAVSAAGLIGFVGLVVPHVLRLLVGADNRVVVPASALLGALALVLADTLARTVMAPRDLPVGAFCALLGGPVFVYLLRRQLLMATP